MVKKPSLCEEYKVLSRTVELQKNEDGKNIYYKTECRHREVTTPKSSPATRHVGAWYERRYCSYSFTTSALDGGEWSASRPGRTLPLGKGPPVPIVQEAGWALEPVWTQRLQEKSFRLCRGSNLIARSSSQWSDTVLSELPRLPVSTPALLNFGLKTGYSETHIVCLSPCWQVPGLYTKLHHDSFIPIAAFCFIMWSFFYSTVYYLSYWQCV
jgi:hypothetical protein